MTCTVHNFKKGSSFIYGWRASGSIDKKTGEVFTSPIDCEKPNYLRCFDCLFMLPINCNQTRIEKCRPCAGRWRAQQRERVSIGLSNPAGWVEVTLTLGGVDEFPWDLSRCNHQSHIPHSGKIGCKVYEADMAVANSKIARQYNDFTTSTRRLLGKDVQFLKVYETQSRGLLHAHILITGAPAIPLKRLSKEWKRLALHHGFGKQSSVKRVVGDSPRDRSRAVNYVSKYLTKGSEITYTLNTHTGEIRKGGYWRVSASRKFAPSLKAIRQLRSLRFLSKSSEGGGLGFVNSRSEEGNEAPPLDYLNLSYAIT